MTIVEQRPDANSVSHEAVAVIAQRRAGELYQDVILRDAKIQEQQQYITHLEARIKELESASPITPQHGVRSLPPLETEALPAPTEG